MRQEEIIHKQAESIRVYKPSQSPTAAPSASVPHTLVTGGRPKYLIERNDDAQRRDQKHEINSLEWNEIDRHG